VRLRQRVRFPGHLSPPVGRRQRGRSRASRPESAGNHFRGRVPVLRLQGITNSSWKSTELMQCASSTAFTGFVPQGKGAHAIWSGSCNSQVANIFEQGFRSAPEDAGPAPRGGAGGCDAGDEH
jgi:hypothetical protein